MCPDMVGALPGRVRRGLVARARPRLALLGHQLMASARPPKKSETIEIRVDYETKSALQAKARTESRSVSDVLRDLIARYLADAPSVSPTRSTIMRFSIAA